MPSELSIIGPAILIAVVLVSALLDRWSVPVILIALGAGIISGSDVLSMVHFDDVAVTSSIANVALIFILFYGGFSTRRDTFRSVALVAGGMATWGVILTAIVTFLVLWGGLGWDLEKSLLLAVIISSTDAAATFSILRRQSLKDNLSPTLEIESAANDPMAILLTLAAVGVLTGGDTRWPIIALSFVWQFCAGIGIGALLGWAATVLLNRLRPQDRGHYYVLTLGIVLLIYGVADRARASGMLAVFVAGFLMGNSTFVHKQGVSNFASALATVADISMFVLMGLLVFPSQWTHLWMQGVVVFLVVTFVARPVAVLIGTLGMKVGAKQKLFVSWAGLRGAVPIILATYPLAAGMEIGNEIFNLVFFVVLLSVAIQGSLIGPLAKGLKLSTVARPRPLYNLELVTMAKSDMDLFVFDIPGPQGRPGPRISELKLPPGTVITLISRGDAVIPPRGNTQLLGWDQITLLAHAADEPVIRQELEAAFAPQEEE